MLKLTWPCWPAMRSATATPSSSALCASIGPRTTSPTAQTLGRLVRHSSSTAMNATFVELEADRLRVQSRGVGHTTDGHDQLVHRQGLRLSLRIGVGHGDPLLVALDLRDLDPELDLETLLGEGLVRLLGNLLVDGAEEGGQRFEHRHLRAQTTPHRPHLQPDHARADHAQSLGHGRDSKRAVVAEDARLRRTPRRAVSAALEPVATITCVVVRLAGLSPATAIS